MYSAYIWEREDRSSTTLVAARMDVDDFFLAVGVLNPQGDRIRPRPIKRRIDRIAFNRNLPIKPGSSDPSTIHIVRHDADKHGLLARVPRTDCSEDAGNSESREVICS